jgi:hypothetical protein
MKSETSQFSSIITAAAAEIHLSLWAHTWSEAERLMVMKITMALSSAQNLWVVLSAWRGGCIK